MKHHEVELSAVKHRWLPYQTKFAFHACTLTTSCTPPFKEIQNAMVSSGLIHLAFILMKIGNSAEKFLNLKSFRSIYAYNTDGVYAMISFLDDKLYITRVILICHSRHV